MEAAERSPNLVDAVGMCFERPGRNQQAVDAVLGRRRLIGKIALHGVEGEINLTRVEAIVVGVLVFRLHDTDDGIRNAVHPNDLAQSFAISEKLFFCVAT